MSVAAVMYTDEDVASDRDETAYEKMAAVRDEASDRDVDASEAADATGSQPGSGSAGYEVVSSADAQEYIQREWIDEVVYAGDKSRPGESDAGNERAELLISECAVMGITVHRILDMRSDSFTAKTVERLGGTYVLTESIRSVSGYQLAEKKLMDIIGGVIGLVFTALLTLFLAPAIFISDPGPVFYSQERVGKNGRVFRIYKFRSMYKDAEKHRAELEEDNETDGMMFKMENDPRVLGSGPDGKRHGLGYFIRRHSLDEFPQFLNVLKGDMSLVGTRPPTVDEWNRYELRHRARLAIKPGLTGLWQTEGRSDIKDFDEVIALDMKYINEWTIAG
ncbi:MAG TPA: sugar transferase, partial [Lachnospiraceae bacterium]|nr:sugar transferase [Lachnospiraceae bacterium]